MEQFLELFGTYSFLGFTVYKWFLIGGALVFLVKSGKKAATMIGDLYERKRKNDEVLHHALEQVAQYPKWHEQSLKIQEKFTNAIEDLRERQIENSKKLEEMEKSSKAREKNKLRDRLLQSYRYYTSIDKNPLQAWSEMESDAFWKMFGDYESLNGDGHMHTEVQPAMRSLEVIPMHETDKITELMQSRR